MPAVVIITRDRPEEVVRTVDHVKALGEAAEIIVVDNASDRSCVDALRRRHPDIRLIVNDRNLGAAARNVGVSAVQSPFVAFSDDDTLWDPGSLTHGAELLGKHPSIGVLAARVLVGPRRREDDVCAAMARSPLDGRPGLPGPRLLGFLAGGSMVRRAAFQQVGGFHHALVIGGEEQLLACDLNSAGWDVVYCSAIATWHLPSEKRDVASRRRTECRNALWFAWLREPAREAWRATVRYGIGALGDKCQRAGAVDAVRGLPWVLRERQVMSPSLAADYRLLERVAWRHRP